MSDNYVHAFKKFNLYKKYFQGNPPNHGPYRNELFFKRAQGSSDPIRLTVAMANYISKSSFKNCPLHL